MDVAVIVPVRNEENSIGPLLDRLLAQTRRPSQIVITDAGSTDATATIIDRYVQKGAPVRLVRSGPANPGRGRNLAVIASDCEWLAFIDGGICPELDWLEKLTFRVAEARADVVYGDWQPVTDTFFKECAAIAYVPPPEKRDGVLIRPHSIASSLMRREVWDGVGGFPEKLRSAEDLLFMNRIEQTGFRITREPRALVHWSLQPNLWRTFRRFVVYARNNIRAGLWRNWQAPLLRRYAILFFLSLPASLMGFKWLVVPLALWIGFLSARALRALWHNRNCYPAGLIRNCFRFFVLLPILATLDFATFVGTLGWTFRDWMVADPHVVRK
jgi:glycosyltransferase involved in cell wall biosynthesis